MGAILAKVQSEKFGVSLTFKEETDFRLVRERKYFYYLKVRVSQSLADSGTPAYSCWARLGTGWMTSHDLWKSHFSTNCRLPCPSLRFQSSP